MAALGVNRAVRLNNKQSFWRLEAFPLVVKEEEEKDILHLMIATFNQGCGYPKLRTFGNNERIYGFTIVFFWKWSGLGALPCENIFIFILSLQRLFLIRVNKL